MAYLLNLETATKNCSVSLAKDGLTIAWREIAGEGYSHAEKLHVFIAEALEEAHLNFKDLDAVAVSQGPGSYTGLRIGVSAAKGLCYALGIPLIAVDTLKTLASRVKIEEGIIVPMLDARRMEVYSAVFDASLNPLRETKAEIIDGDSFAALQGKVFFIGDGAEKSKMFLDRPDFIFLDHLLYPSAKDMSTLSFQQYEKSDTVDVAYFEPFYLKEFMLGK